jgi:transcriptional regulator with XRE-family HTH domain
MNATELLNARQTAKLEQIDAAKKLGISQPYLSLLESGKREITEKIALRAVKMFRLPPTSIPPKFNFEDSQPVSNEILREDIAALGFADFAGFKKKTRHKNPADVLFQAISKDNLDSETLKALPWLIVEFYDLKWEDVVKACKLNNLQNRLGFLISLAINIAVKKGEFKKASSLSTIIAELEKSKLFREEYLCNSSPTPDEQTRFKSKRSKEAESWRIFTDLNIEDLE